jgi:hypothetical protein
MTLWRFVSSTVYHPCGTIEVTFTVYYHDASGVTALGIEEILPPGWTFVELVTYSEQPDIAPDAGDTMLEFAWVDVPAFPVTVTYRAQVPANASGDQTIMGSALYRRDGPELRSPVVYTTLEEGEGLEGDCGEGEGEMDALPGAEGESGSLDSSEGEGEAFVIGLGVFRSVFVLWLLVFSLMREFLPAQRVNRRYAYGWDRWPREALP